MLPYLCFAEMNISSLDRKRTSGRHRIACIHGQVKNCLFKLAAIDFNLPNFGVDLKLQRNCRAEQTLQHLAYFVQDGAKIHDIRLKNLFAEQYKQLARE